MANKNKRFADDGWAVWVDGDDTSTVYINDWLDPTGKSYLDMAIRIRGVKESAALHIYIPFPIAESEIEDVSLKLHEEGLLRAIFSAACIIDYKKNAYTSEIAYNGRTIDLIHLSAWGFRVEPLTSGSVLTVDLKDFHAYLDNNEGYLLFRIPHKSLDEIFKPRVNMDHTLRRFRDILTSPVISDQYGYSIRINEARLLPSEINRIGAFHRQKLKKAVVTISLHERYEMNSVNCYRILRLEEELYRDYVPAGFACENVITYQWNQNRDSNLWGHFNFYFDIACSSVSKSSLLIYLFLLLTVGMVGSALWELIKYLFGLF